MSKQKVIKQAYQNTARNGSRLASYYQYPFWLKYSAEEEEERERAGRDEGPKKFNK